MLSNPWKLLALPPTTERGKGEGPLMVSAGVNEFNCRCWFESVSFHCNSKTGCLVRMRSGEMNASLRSQEEPCGSPRLVLHSTGPLPTNWAYTAAESRITKDIRLRF